LLALILLSDIKFIGITHGVEKPGFDENTSLHPAESEKNPVSWELRMGLRNRVFDENTSLHSAESEKNPVSLVGVRRGRHRYRKPRHRMTSWI
jgi:hypothetical protein